MAGSGDERFLGSGLAVVGLAAATVIGFAGAVDARPLRGPVMRAERRVVRAQAILERELARPPAGPRVAERTPAPGRDRASGVATPAEQPRTAGAAPSPAAAAAPAAPATPPTAASRSGVARATFEAPAPTPAATGDAARSTNPEPAADGTFSVLVRPEADGKAPAGGTPAQSVEPLRFPDASTP